MREATPWLSQGDVFESVPHATLRLDAAGIRAELEHVASVLVTHSCVLDKPKTVRLQFAPLAPIRSLEPGMQGHVRRPTVTPAEFVHVGDVAGLETVAVLSALFTVPKSYFLPELRSYVDHPEDPDGDLHLTATAQDTRVGTMDADAVDLLRHKMAGFWPRFRVPGGPG